MAGPLFAQVNVTTYHNDVSRTGANTQETILTPINVNNSQFGRLFSVPVDGAVYAQPLYLSNVSIAGGTHNVVYVATEHDSLYAIDADTGAIYFQVSLIPAGGTTVNSASDLSCTDLVPEIGITGTPVIDPGAMTIYLVAKSKVSGRVVQYLHAMDVRTLAEKAGSPVLIQGSVPGNTADGNGTTVPFDPKLHNQRAALLLENGHVVIAWGSHCDIIPWHGWLMSYNATTLAQEAVYNTTTALAPSDVNGCGGIWMSGGGPAADAAGNIYFATGNGGFDGSTDLSDSIIKLGPPVSGAFPVLDFFTPFNQATLQADDADLGSGGVVLLPPSSAGLQLLAQQSKQGTIYLLNTANLGKYCINQVPACSTSDPQIAEEIQGASSGIWGSPAYWNGNLYWTGANDPIQAFSFNPNSAVPISRAPTSQSAQIFAYSAPTPSISANGNTNGILWALDGSADDSTCDGGGANCLGLYAYDATNLSHLLYRSTLTANNRDSPGTAVKFETPVIANGKVYVGTQSALSVYGILSTNPVAASPVFGTAPGAFTTAQSVSLSDITPGASIYYTTDGSTPTTSSSVYTTPIPITATTTINAIAAANGWIVSAVASGTFIINSQGVNPSIVNLATSYNIVGVVNDGTVFTGGGFDGDGAAFPAAVLGTSVSWNGSTFNFGTQGVADAVSGAVIPLPAGYDTAVNLLASGVNGNQQNQTFIVTYTDGSTASYTQSVSDWFTPQNYAGEAKVLSTPYRVQQNGSRDNNGPFWIYGYSFPVDSSRAVKSITLPNNRSVVVLAVDVSTAAALSPTLSPVPGNFSSPQSVTLTDATPGARIYYTVDGTTPTTASTAYVAPIQISTTTTINAMAAATGYANSAVTTGTYTLNASTAGATQVSLAAAANTYAIGNVGTPNSGLSGYDYPANLLGSALTWSGQTFALGNAAAPNAASGTTIALPAGNYTSLSFLGTGLYGNQPNQTFVVTYTDGTTTTYTQNLSDWGAPQTNLGEAIAATVAYRTTPAGTTQNGPWYLYGYTFALNGTKTVRTLTLPANPNVVVLAVDLSNSAVSTVTPTAPAAFSPAGGNFTSVQTVTLSDSTPGAIIYYTTDGSTPTAASTPYSTPIQVNATTTINTIAIAPTYTPSTFASATYTINLPVAAATPTLSPAPGTYASAQTVTLAQVAQNHWGD